MSGIEEFLKEFGAKRTQNTYRAVLKGYFKVIGATPETYFTEGRDYQADVKKYKNEFLNDRPPKTYTSYMSGINSYLKENGVDLGSGFWKTLKGRKKGAKSNRAITKDRVPTPEEMKQILSHGGAKERAFFLILVSSGMRIGELCQIGKGDIYLDEDPARIDIPPKVTKTGERRTTFMSNEARNALNEWLKVRDNYVEYAITKNNLPGVNKTVNDDRVFPFNQVTGWRYWTVMLQKAGFTEKDTQTKRAVLHLHVLRKYFRTNMPKTIGLDMTEELLGHSGYLTEYRKHSDKELAEAYKNGQSAVLIFEREIAQDLTEVSTKLKQKDDEIAKMKADIEKMHNEILTLQNLETLAKLLKKT
jgi:integrase